MQRSESIRLLYRLSVSPHKDELILKGGSLFYVWTDQLHRPTKDLDFLGSGRPDVQRIRDLFAGITTIANFALPCLSAIRSGMEFNAIWRGGTWIHETRDN